jgi:hypothetical protein
MELSSPPKLSNSRPSRVKGSLHGEVHTSSPIIQKKKLKAKRMKNNFKQMFDKPNSSNSDKNDDSDCCEECKEYCCVTKEECDWIKHSVCEKWLRENCTYLSKTCIDCGHKNCSENVKKRTKSTKT